MTLKLSQLDWIINKLNSKGFSKQFPEQELRNIVAERFGISEYVQNNIKKALKEYGYIKEINREILEIIKL